jgi:hypothetical protein
MTSRKTVHGFLLLPMLFGLAACNSLEKPDVDLTDNAEFMGSLKSPEESKLVIRHYPFTIAIAPPVFEWRVVKDEDGKEITPVISGREFEEPFEPEKTKRFSSEQLAGVNREYLNAKEIATVLDDNSPSAATSEPKKETEKDKAVTPGVDVQPTPDPRPRRRIRLGQGLSRPLGINSELLERELIQRLYGPNSYSGYGGAEAVAKADEDKKEKSKSANKVEDSKTTADKKAGANETAEVPEDFSKGLLNDWDAQNATDIDVAGLKGWDFRFNAKSYTSRMKAIFDQFALFEEVKELSNTGKAFKGIREAADVQYADLVMTTRIKRFKVAYHGETALYIPNSLVYLTLWWPSLFVADEEFRLHFEVTVDINDVRSKTNLFHKNIIVEKDVLHSDLSRGWFPFSQYVTPRWHNEGTFRTVAQKDLAAAVWQAFEKDLMRELHMSFRETLNAPNFEKKINDSVEGRSEGLVIGISKYGPKAHSILEQFDRQALKSVLTKDEQSNYKNYAIRPFAENDANKMAEFMGTGDAVAVDRAYLRKRVGKNANLKELRTAIHKLTRARKDDRSFVYINLESVVVDVSQKLSPDGLLKYLLPHDCDLEKLEQELAPLRQQIAALQSSRLSTLAKKLADIQQTLDKTYKGAAIQALQKKLLNTEQDYKVTTQKLLNENPALFDQFSKICVDFFDNNAISFKWLETQFVSNSTIDRVSLQSKSALLILDTTFPGQFTDLHYAPRFEFKLGYQPSKKGSVLKLSVPAKRKKTDNAEKKEVDPKELIPNQKNIPEIEINKDNKDGKKRRRIRLGYFDALKSAAMNAGSKKDKKDQKEKSDASPQELEEQVGISSSFMDVLVRPGAMIVLSTGGTQRPLEFPNQELGAFVYHFTAGAANDQRVARINNQVSLSNVLSYVSRRIGQQTWALGSPQELKFIRRSRKDDFILIQDSK